MAESYCEVPGCTMPGTVCPACQRCLCWQHLHSSPCEICRKIVSKHSFEYQFGRLVSIGLSVLLLGILFFFLPHDAEGINIQLAILFMVGGLVLFWLGFLART